MSLNICVKIKNPGDFLKFFDTWQEKSSSRGFGGACDCYQWGLE